MTTVGRAELSASLLNLVRKDARRKSRRKALGALVAAALKTLIDGWYLMLAVGIVHHEWIRSCPTIGYWWAVLLCFLIRGALNYVPTAKSEADR